MRCTPPSDRPIDLYLPRDAFVFTADLDELEAGLAVWSHPTRLRIFALLDRVEQMCGCDPAEVLGVSVSAAIRCV